MGTCQRCVHVDRKDMAIGLIETLRLAAQSP
jgi:hypothetical protein